MAAADLDIGYLAAHLGTPEDTLISVTANPTADLVNAVLAAVMTKAHEYDGLYSQKLQLEVELETNVRGAEAQRDRSNETAKKALKDVEEIREKLKQEGKFYRKHMAKPAAYPYLRFCILSKLHITADTKLTVFSQKRLGRAWRTNFTP